MQYKDYYQTMGVNKDATQDEIKQAYRKMARKYHPDVNPGDKAAEEKFKEINEANEVLSDPEKRKKYDRFGSQWQQYQRAGGSPEDFDWAPWQAQPGGTRTYTRSVSPEEFEQMFGHSAGGFSDFFETLFGGWGGQRETRFGFDTDRGTFQPHPRRGRDNEQVIRITLAEAFHGTTRALQWENGRKIEAKIPLGVHTGSRIRLKGQGEPGVQGANAGDLYLKIDVTPHADFERQGDNLQSTISVDLYTVLLGGEVEVSSIDKTVKLTIPPETANGKVFRLRGLGMPSLRNPDQRGDLYATVQVKLPRNLTAAQKDLIKQLREMDKSPTPVS